MNDGQGEVIEESLPFSRNKQEALLGHILLNDKFFNQIKNKIQKSWFVDGRCNQVFGALVAESVNATKKLTPTELKECYTFMRISDNKERESLCNCINIAIAQTANFRLEILTPELTDWLKARVFVEGVYKSRDLFNSSKQAVDVPSHRQRRVEAYRILQDMSKNINDIEFEGNEEVSFDNLQSSLLDFQTEYKDALTFGNKTVDKLLLPEANGVGSLLKGDMTILMGPQNAGKTSAMITVVAANLVEGKNVILIPHEGRVNDLKLKLIQCICGLTKTELFQFAADPANKPKFIMLEELFQEHLVYMPMIKAGLNIEDVGDSVRRAIDRFMAKHNGKTIDLVVDDYLARCTSIQNGRGQFQKRERDQVVYEYGSSLAGECYIHLLTGIQVNRKGNEINRGVKGAEKRLLVPEDVSESYGTMMVATNILSLNRTPTAQANERLTFLICKSRSSETHVAITCGTSYPTCCTHNNTMGSTWYRGVSTMEERLDELMGQYEGVQIPDNLVLDPPEV
jgi:replicative DNA helicase